MSNSSKVSKSPIDVHGHFSMRDMVAVVTGAGGGVGGAIAAGFLASGAAVALVDLDPDALNERVDSLGKLGAVSSHACDVTDPEAVAETIRSVDERHGHIDVVCNSAGIARRTPAVDLEMSEFRHIWDVNVGGTWLVSQAAGRSMIKANRPGKIVNIGSVRGQVGHPLGYVSYATSKGAVHQLTRQLATEWAQYRINVNCLAPSVIDTPLAAYILDDPGRTKMFMDRIPLRRLADLDDIVGAAIFLASPAGNFITGQILYIDGGLTAG
jgi:gluconate 5-dehydrogenase